jgi:hypothetical protein
MRFSNAYSISTVAVLCALIPTGTRAADPPATRSAINVSAAARSDAVRVWGTISGAHQFQAVLYATFAPDVPIVLLSRQPLATDANGHFDATIPVAPAYFQGAIITVTVQTLAGVSVGGGSITIGAPSFTEPSRK